MNAGELHVAVHGTASIVGFPVFKQLIHLSPFPSLFLTVQIRSDGRDRPIPIRSTFIKEPLSFPGLEPAVPDQNPDFESDLL
jgi:hypothetical protein